MEKFNFKRKFGQNFLRDKNLITKIVSIANIEPNSLTIEVGVGKGILTEELAKQSKKVLAYEIDNELKPFLEEKFQDMNNLEIIFDDFLKRDINKDLEKNKYDNLYFVSNVPYYITTPILMKLIESKKYFKKIVMMVQEEVGERFSAKPGNKEYGSISVFLNYYYDIKKEFKVNRNMFVPVPKVDSVVISFSKKENSLSLKNENVFFQLVKDSFQYKRKNLRNNLKKYDLAKIEKILLDNNFSLNNRAEQIPVEVFIKISNELS